MKFTTIVVGFLSILVAVTALLLADDLIVPDEHAPPLMGDMHAISSSGVDEAESARVSERARSPVNTGSTQVAALSGAEPMRLFASPDFGSIEYRNAWENANRYLANSRRQSDTSGMQLLKRNEAVIEELVRQLGTNPEGLKTSFEISPSNIYACTISSVEDRSPGFTPGPITPSSYSVETTCYESGNEVTVSVDRREVGTVAFAIRDVQGGVSILSVDESGYAVVFQRYPFVPTNTN